MKAITASNIILAIAASIAVALVIYSCQALVTGATVILDLLSRSL